MENITIREGKLGDESAFAYIQINSWKSAFNEILSKEELEKHTECDRIEKMYHKILEQGKIHTLIQEINGKPHCIACWGENRDNLGMNVAELICIHSLQDKWRNGYGSKMMFKVIEDISNAGFDTVSLWVFEQNERARKFYEKQGFAITDNQQARGTAKELMYIKVL